MLFRGVNIEHQIRTVFDAYPTYQFLQLFVDGRKVRDTDRPETLQQTSWLITCFRRYITTVDTHFKVPM